MGLGPSCSSWLVQESANGWEVVSPNNVPGGTIVEVGESIAGVDSTTRAPQQRNLKLAMRIGH